MKQALGILALGVLAYCLYLGMLIASDYQHRMGEQDHHYCVAIEGHTEAECAAAGR